MRVQIKIFAYLVFFLFAFVGVTMTIITVHEYTHKIDFEKYSVGKDNIACLLNVGDFDRFPSIAYYTMPNTTNNIKTFNLILDKSEFKASLISYTLMIVLYGFLFLVMGDIMSKLGDEMIEELIEKSK